MTMGDRIKELRENSGMTQEQLGAILGVQKSAIRKYEKGAVENIKRSTIKKMASTFGVSPSYLMCFDEDKNEHSNSENTNYLNNYDTKTFGHIERELLENFRTLNKNGQEKAIEYITDLAGNAKYTQKIYKIAARNGQFVERPLSDSEVESLMNCPDVDDL